MRGAVHRWIDHTAELEVELEAPTPDGVFGAAAEALAELLGTDGEPAARRSVRVEAVDRAALLAAFLEELVFLAESEGLVARSATARELRDDHLIAELDLVRTDPPHLVKAVTYHRLTFEPHRGGYRATAVLDV